MAYVKNVWKDGDIITSEKLNHIEYGIAQIEEEYELINNKVTEITDSTDEDKYPSAKAVFNLFNQFLNAENTRW